MELVDLVSEGIIALIGAVDDFDWTRGHKFSTFAKWRIRAYMASAYAEQSKVIRTPRNVHALAEKARASMERLVQQGRDSPTPEEIARESGLSQSQVDRVSSIPVAVPIEVLINGDSVSLADLVYDHSTEPVWQAVRASEVNRRVREALQELLPLEANVVVLRHGLHGGPPMNCASTGKRLGLTPGKVSQIEKNAFTKIRTHRPELSTLV